MLPWPNAGNAISTGFLSLRTRLHLYAFGVTGMMLRIPMPDTTLDFAEEVEATLVRQVPEVADQICDGMLVPGAPVPSKTTTASAAHAM